MTHKANPEHFHRAVEHGLSLVAGGAAPAMLDVMVSGCLRRGLADAADGYMHAKLRLMVAREGA